MTTATEQHKQQCDEVRKIREELSTRVGVLEKWRWIIIGGSIIIGFIAQKFMLIGG
jgi:hypothetical protein